MIAPGNRKIDIEVTASDNTKSGFDSVGQSLQKLRRSSSALFLVNQAIGDMPGYVGNAIRSINGLVASFSAFGPLGLVATGILTSIKLVGDYFQDKAEKMVEAAQAAGEKIRSQFIRLKEDALQSLAKEVERTAKAADNGASAFDRMASHAQKLSAVRLAFASAKDQGSLASMRSDMTLDVGEAPDSEKARVAAAWRVQIAEEEAKIAENAAQREKDIEEAALKTAEKRIQMLQKNLSKLVAEAEKAAASAREADAVYGKDDPHAIATWKVADAAESSAAKAAAALDAAKRELEEAREQAKVNDILRANSVAGSKTALSQAWFDYEKAERDYANALVSAQEAAEEERRREIEREAEEEKHRRIEVEKAIAQERTKLLQQEITSCKMQMADANARLAQAQAKVSQAWGWYRNKDSLAAQLEEEKANAEAEKQFEKEFKSLKRKTHWRTRDDLSLDQEAVRRVALAREERDDAAEYLAKIEQNTADLARKLDELLQIK